MNHPYTSMIKDMTYLDTRYSRFSAWRRKLDSTRRDLEDAFANGEVCAGEFPVVVHSKKSGRFAIFTR